MAVFEDPNQCLVMDVCGISYHCSNGLTFCNEIKTYSAKFYGDTSLFGLFCDCWFNSTCYNIGSRI